MPRESFEIIIVDGSSKDKTREIAARYADKVILQVSKGVGGARNDGAQIAKGEILATTDADCLPCEDWLKVIQDNFKEDVVATTGTLIPIITEDMSTFETFTYKFIFKISNGILRLGSWIGYYHLCGANSAFNREAFIKIGGYSDLPYSDDIEISKRLKPLGKIVFDKKIQLHYSIRRIKKLGLLKYIFTIFRNDFEVMVLGQKPLKDEYAKQTY
jgi:glycosyltransferase involved in cell wall biosynthesis